MSRYLPLSDNDRREMMDVCGVKHIDELFASIPEGLKYSSDLNIDALTEPELIAYFKKLAEKNKSNVISFAGAGAYSHFIPSSVNNLASRQEFLTAYTPYQPEISQGTLQVIFEYQTMICEITGMDISNASMYDGATAFTESILMAKRIGKKLNTVLISDSIHPHYRKVAKTYLSNLGINMVSIPVKDTVVDMEALKQLLETHDDVFAVVCGYPNFFGSMDPLDKIVPMVRDTHKKAMAISVTMEPLSLGLMTPPGEFDIDIAVGEAQSFGNYPGFGGPMLGFLTCKQKYLRNMPGRLAGETVDKNGKKGYVLTLSAREQHIRRDKATSNICSNQGWCMLRACIYLTLLGKKGLTELAQANHSLAEYAKNRINSTQKFKVVNSSSFNEFTVETTADFKAFREVCITSDIFPGVHLAKFGLKDNRFLICVTETISKADIDLLVDIMEKAQ